MSMTTPNLSLSKPEAGDTDWASEINGNWDTLDEAVVNGLFDANTILAANSDDTPAAVTVAEGGIVGRPSGGNIKSLTQAEAHTVLFGSGSVDEVASCQFSESPNPEPPS